MDEAVRNLLVSVLRELDPGLLASVTSEEQLDRLLFDVFVAGEDSSERRDTQ